MTLKYNTVKVNGIKVPATFHDALLKIKDGFQKGNVDFRAAGGYELYIEHEHRKVYCPIGYLLTRRQRKEIEGMTELFDAHDGDNSIGGPLWDIIGEKNMVAMLAMDREMAQRLQTLFDNLGQDHIGEFATRKSKRNELNKLLNMWLSLPNTHNPVLGKSKKYAY